MKSEQINTAIAESLGWEWKPETPKPTGQKPAYCWHRPDGHWAERPLFYEVRRKEDHCDQLPDCYSDLNACAEFEAALTNEQFNKLSNRLSFIVGWRESPPYSTPGWRRRYVSATAPQRCEAYLHTIGEWEDQS